MAILAIAADGPPAAPDDADPAETHTRIVVIQSEKDGEPADRGPGESHVRRRAGPARGQHPGNFRPGVVPAGSSDRGADELSLATRDEVLGDSIPPAAKDAKNVELATVFHITKGLANRAAVRNEKQGKYETLLKYEPGGDRKYNTAILPSSARSPRRSRKQFPAVLGQLGATGKPM